MKTEIERARESIKEYKKSYGQSQLPNDCIIQLMMGHSKSEQLILSGVVKCVYVVTERDNYGEQLFKGVFSNKEKATKYLAEDGLKESNIDEITEIDID